MNGVLVWLLIDHGANITLRDKFDEMALMWGRTTKDGFNVSEGKDDTTNVQGS